MNRRIKTESNQSTRVSTFIPAIEVKFTRLAEPNLSAQEFPSTALLSGFFSLPSLKQNHRGPAMQANMSCADMSPSLLAGFWGKEGAAFCRELRNLG
jgi:hypothetical protein